MFGIVSVKRSSIVAEPDGIFFAAVVVQLRGVEYGLTSPSVPTRLIPRLMVRCGSPTFCISAFV